MADLSANHACPSEGNEDPGQAGSWAALLDELPAAAETKAEEDANKAWLLDTSTETAASLLKRPIRKVGGLEERRQPF